MSFDVEINGLIKKYGEITAVDGLNLQVNRGEMLGLIGPDGAGKTTTLRILCGLLKPNSGSASVGGFNVLKQMGRIREIIGYMPQRFSLYPDLTVAENMRFFADLFGVPKNERERHLERLLNFSKLGPFIARRAGALSGGMKQKLALSCTLIHTPRILFLDEPTTGVDPVSRREFWAILKDLRDEGVTIIVSTPYMDEAAKCNRVAFIHKGKILSVEPPEEIHKLFSGILYELHCAGFVAAARSLENEPDIHSVQIFGDKVHISGQDAGVIEKTVPAKLLTAGISEYSLVKIKPGIEDVFVDLMK